MAGAYDPKNIEKKWQETWEKDGIYRTSDSVQGKENFYTLVEFAYPSGNLHVGHWYAFGVPDIYARYQRMRGKNVLYPIGFDSFGLPAENAAIKRGLDPKAWTYENMETMRAQLRSMGAMFDWDRAIATSDPEYYKWTQDMFAKFFEKDLVYRATTKVNWCPKDQTILANEQVVDGKCERCDTEVMQKDQDQWSFRITKYADRLHDDLENLDWPESIKDSQRSWIGRSEGAEITFKIKKDEPIGDIPIMVDHKNPPVEGKPTVRRRNIHAVVYSPKRDAYLTFVWKKLPWTTIVVGGVDEDEDLVEAAQREVREETGYTDLQFEGILGSPIESHYFAAHKDENREAVTTGIYFTLRSEVQVSVAEEERVHNDVVWMPAPEFLPEKLAHVEIAAWLERIAELKKASSIKVFTTRPDTLFGVTYVTLSPEHPLLETLPIENRDEVVVYAKQAKNKSDLERQQSKEKTGIELRGVKAVNPANGQAIPIWVSDYVLAGYGTGAVMAVPAHDERDFEFAKKFGLPARQVVAREFISEGKNAPREDVETLERRTVSAIIKHPTKDLFLVLQEKENTVLVGGGVDEGESPEMAMKREILEETGYKNANIKEILFQHLLCFGFRHTKQKNQKTDDIFYYVELEDEEKITSEADTERHTILWLAPEDVSRGITWEHHRFVWESFFNKKPFVGQGLLVESGQFSGLSSEEAKAKIVAFVGGEMKKTYRLRDWGISRQRYWGVPIPVVYDPEGNPHAVPTEHLPWLLPTDVDHTPDGTAPLARSKELFERTEKIFGKGWKPEVETMDTFVDSSWYFYRYLDAKNDKEFCSKDKQENWMPIDMYFGGAEHTTMHLLYSRFWNKALFDLGLVKDSEPYARRRNRGLILGPDGNKMSKSKGNVIDPDEVVSRVGADTVRMYLAFMGPYGVTDHYPWDPNGVVGVRRFLERVWDLKNRIAEGPSHPLVHKTIKKFKDDIERLKFNTAISAGMILINELETISKEDYLKFLQILAPFAPHMTEELWREMGETSSIHLSKWPEYDESKIKDEKITIAIQINGKVRDEMEIDPDMSEEDIRSHVLVREKIVEKLAGQAPKKVFYVKGRLINIVV